MMKKNGNKLSENDPNELVTTYKYDSFGNLTQINYPDGIKTDISLKWNTATNPPNAKYYTTTTSSGKPDLSVYYDILGREVCRKDDGYYYQTIFNKKGQIEKTSFPFQNFNDKDILWHNYTYDDFGRKKTEQAPYIDLSYIYNNRKITVIDHLRNNTQSWKEYDGIDRIINVEDAGGTIKYEYSVIVNDKTHETIITNNGVTSKIISDLWGNRLSITDPDAGTITSTYNKFNELVKQIDARGDTTIYQYDKLGRITLKRFSDINNQVQTINYIYDLGNKGKGQLSQIKMGNIIEESFTYDNFGRLSIYWKRGTPFPQRYTYNNNGQLETLTYPDNFAVKYKYTTTGKLFEISNGSDNRLIYQVATRNKYNAPLRCEYGNGITTIYNYNAYGLPTRILNGVKPPPDSYDLETGYQYDRGDGEMFFCNECPDSSVFNYRYAYDNRGLMVSRSESFVNRLETYKYDDLDRLIQVKSGTIGQAGSPQEFSYYANGNISENSFVGSYFYGSKPHAVVKNVPVNQNVFSSNPTVSYNFFNQPSQITDRGYSLGLSYGADQQRNKAVKYKNSIPYTRNYYSKYYEREYDTETIRHYHYIYGDNGVVALNIATSNLYDITTPNDSLESSNFTNPIYDRSNSDPDTMYYVHADHLGSICAITDKDKNIVQRNHFDAWGNPLSLPNLTGFSLINRGFTGHEHYPEFKIINMNSRLYDPVIGRFFSPDNYVQIPEFTQAFNRYSYCLNNPLKYTDPSGWWIPELDKDNNITLRREDGDTKRSLRQYMGTEWKRKDINKLWNSMNEGGCINLTATWGGVFQNMTTAITEAQLRNNPVNDDWKIPDVLLERNNEKNYNCWGAAIALNEGKKLEGTGPGTGVGIRYEHIFDQILNDYYYPTSGNGRSVGRTVVRYADSRNVGTHGATFMGIDRSGNEYFFTKNGWQAQPEILTLDYMKTYIPQYGRIRGINPGESGYYNKYRYGF